MIPDTHIFPGGDTTINEFSMYHNETNRTQGAEEAKEHHVYGENATP